MRRKPSGSLANMSSSVPVPSKWSPFMTCSIAIFVFLVLVRLFYVQLDNNTSNLETTNYISSNSIRAISNSMRTGGSITGMTQVPPEYAELCGKLWKSSDCQRYMPRLIEYCNINEPAGEEGHISMLDDYELVHLLVAIRHGDRTSLNRIPGSSNTIETMKYLPEKLFIEPEVKSDLDLISSMKIEYEISASVEKNMYNPLDRKNLLTTPDKDLISGELTSRGFMQHYWLGHHLNQAYGEFLEKIDKPSQLYIRSTNYNRTIQSVASFISTFLPKLSSKANIHVYANDEDEVMHGVGQKLSSKVASSSSASAAAHDHMSITEGGDVVVEGSCKKAVILAQEQSGNTSSAPSFNQEIAEMFSIAATKKRVTDIADASLPSICHKKALPCSRTKPHECMSIDLMYEAIREGDRLYCSRYSGHHGGAQGTKLSLYPFLSEIIQKLETASSSSSSSSYGITIFSGHDTVIAPTLAGLGVYDRDSFLCRWPSYASRIVFELYQPSPSSSSSGIIKHDDMMVRVAFNGIDITSRIPACTNSTIYIGNSMKSANKLRGVGVDDDNVLSSSSRYPWSLCPLTKLRAQVESMIQPYSTFHDACKM